MSAQQPVYRAVVRCAKPHAIRPINPQCLDYLRSSPPMISVLGYPHTIYDGPTILRDIQSPNPHRIILCQGLWASTVPQSESVHHGTTASLIIRSHHKAANSPAGRPGTSRRVREEFAVPRRPNMNIISCLQYIAAHPTTGDGKSTTPVVYDSGCLEEICGACTMVINGRVRQSCSALVDKLATGQCHHAGTDGQVSPDPRSVCGSVPAVQRSEAQSRPGCRSTGPTISGKGPPISQKLQQERYPLSRCISCGCCLEACPQYTPVNQFVGAAVISQVRLFNDHPTGAALKEDRLDTLMEEGGVADCGKAGNCVQVCPKEIPLLESIADGAAPGDRIRDQAILRWLIKIKP